MCTSEKKWNERDTSGSGTATRYYHQQTATAIDLLVFQILLQTAIILTGHGVSGRSIPTRMGKAGSEGEDLAWFK